MLGNKQKVNWVILYVIWDTFGLNNFLTIKGVFNLKSKCGEPTKKIAPQLQFIIIELAKALQILLVYHNYETKILLFDCLTGIPKPKNRRLFDFFVLWRAYHLVRLRTFYDVFAELTRFHSIFLSYALKCVG